LERKEETDRALEGCSAVVHAAGKVGDWGDKDAFKRVNTDLTERLIRSAESLSIERFIYISSISVHGFGPHRNSTEKGPYYPLVSAYQRTKCDAEKLVILKGSEQLKMTVLRPGNVYGPGDTTTFYNIFDAMLQGIMPMIGSGKKLTCPVYVDDFADSVVLSLKNPRSIGEIFNITGGERVTWRDILYYSSSLMGIDPIRFPLPPASAVIAAYVAENSYRLLGIQGEPPLTKYRVDHVTHDFHFDISKAEELIGFQPATDYRTGFKKTINAYLAQKRGNK
jgi:nucleoside-diphosphate-sugar epimerase